MKRLLPIIAGIYLAACSDAGETSDSLDKPKARLKTMLSTWSPEDVERCDRITFVAMMKAYGASSVDITAYESPSGRWNRDVKACWPDDSRSECSLDGYLSVLHVATDKQLSDMETYLSANDWICGAGDKSATNIIKLASIIQRMNLAEVTNPFEGFRGHLLANYLWLHARISGGMSPLGKSLLARLYRDMPESPYISALTSRFTGKKTDAAAKAAVFTNCAQWWGSCDDATYLAMTLAVLQGR